MRHGYYGPEFMKPYFCLCPAELEASLPAYYAHQGIQCPNGHGQLVLFKRVDYPVLFAHCETCHADFKIYENGDYPAGYIADDPTKPLEPIVCSCGGQVFVVAVGYEYPGDEVDSTDITWFTLVGKCTNCGNVAELFHDETG